MSRWNKENTSSAGFWSPLASSGKANSSRCTHWQIWFLARDPSLLSCLQILTHSVIPLSFIHSPPPDLATGELLYVAMEQASLIEHLFRHGAGSAACGRASGGTSVGRITSNCISQHALLHRMHIWPFRMHNHSRRFQRCHQEYRGSSPAASIEPSHK